MYVGIYHHLRHIYSCDIYTSCPQNYAVLCKYSIEHVHTLYIIAASEESRELLLKGLKESTSKVRNNIFGAAGSGKTSVMAVMMGEKPPETRDSTGCATCPVRGMTTTRISKSGRVWTRVPYSQISWQLATAFKVVAMRTAGSTLYVQIESVNTASPEPSSSGGP